jgi:hypothetical protein
LNLTRVAACGLCTNILNLEKNMTIKGSKNECWR